MTPWEKLNQSPIHLKVISDWKSLVNDKKQTEHAYLDFLKNHAGFFAPRMHYSTLAIISELRLGSDYRVDFVVAASEGSMGFKYTLIEIESPHTPAFSASGKPSARLTAAQQQIRDWKKWISTNSEESKRIFPSWESHFDYMIIIGRNTDPHLERRNDLSRESGVMIRSFDYISDLMNRIWFKNRVTPSCDTNSITQEQENELGNPFFKAYSDTQWRNIIKSPSMKGYHIISNNIEEFIKNRSYNDERLAEFKEYLNNI